MNEAAIRNTEISRISRSTDSASSQWARYCRDVVRTLSDAGNEAAEILRGTFGSLISEAFHSDRSADAKLGRDLRRDIGVE